MDGLTIIIIFLVWLLIAIEISTRTPDVPKTVFGAWFFIISTLPLTFLALYHKLQMFLFNSIFIKKD